MLICDMAQDVNRRRLRGGRVRSHANRCGICGGRRCTVKRVFTEDYFSSVSVISPVLHGYSSTVIWAFDGVVKEATKHFFFSV